MISTELPLLAVGVGCRSGCAPAVIRSLVTQALESWRTLDTGRQRPARAPMTMFTILEKQEDRGLRSAADELAIELRFFSREALQKVSARVLTKSAASIARFGVHSVAEAAALVGAGLEAVLVVPRLSGNGVTCAIATALTPLEKLMQKVADGQPL